MSNRLQNPSFEKDWATEASHSVLICEPGQPPRVGEVGNVFSPPGWLTWYQHDETYAQPEVRDAWRAHDSRRVRSGEKAILFFTFYRRHKGGFLQQVDVQPGQRLRFTAWMHAWSNSKDPDHPDWFPHPDDGKWSEGAGYQEIAWREHTQPHDTGDPQQDAKANFTFVVGIDPTGGCDPLADTVVWGESYHIYNGYCQQLSVEVVARASKITVFTYSETLWPFKHDDHYLDDAELMIVSDNPPPPSERGQPRVQYPRTYVLLPPDADAEWALAVIDSAWDKHRYTLGGSADDAGLGDLDERNIIAINPDQWPNDLLAFYGEHYPGVNVETIEAATPTILKQILNDDRTDIVCCQRDPRWASDDLGEDPGGETIGEAGCYLCGYVMALRHAGHWVNPPELNKILADSGEPFVDDDMLVNWHAAVCLFPETFDGAKKDNTQYTADGLQALLEKDWEIILRRADGKHFVYLERVEGNALHVIDSWDGQRKVWTQDMAQGIRAAHRGQVSETGFTLRGVHDLAGADWLRSEGLPGWCTVACYLGTDPRQLSLHQYVDADIRVILRLNYSYAQDDPGGMGTMPPPDKLEAHEDAVVETMHLNPDAWGFIYGNEPNNKREWPKGFTITPKYYRDSYNRIWARKPPGARLSPCAIDPYNAAG